MTTLDFVPSRSLTLRSPQSPAAAACTGTPRAGSPVSLFLHPTSHSSIASSSSNHCGASALPLGRGYRKSKLSGPGRLRCNANLADYATLTAVVYGTALVGGGTFAYLRTGSKGSLSGGLTGGALMAATYFLQSSGSETTGNALGFGAALLFAAVFGIRLIATKKPLPAGPLLAISAAAAAVFSSTYLG